MSDSATDGVDSHADGAFGDSLALARGGAVAQIGELLETCRPYLLAIAESELPGDLHAKVGASDIVQDTLARGAEHFDDFRGHSAEELAGWLRRILLNHLANVRKSYDTDKRSVQREQPVDSGIVNSFQPSPSAEIGLVEDAQRLEAALQRLPPDYRTVIQLRHREDRSFAEIGAALGKSEDAVGKLWARAVRQLQSELQQ